MKIVVLLPDMVNWSNHQATINSQTYFTKLVSGVHTSRFLSMFGHFSTLHKKVLSNLLVSEDEFMTD